MIDLDETTKIIHMYVYEALKKEIQNRPRPELGHFLKILIYTFILF